MVSGELFGELLDGFGVAREEPAAEGFGEVVEGGGAFGERVDRGCDGGSRIEHGVKIGEGVIGVEEVGGDRVKDELASSSGDEPIMSESDGWGRGRVFWVRGEHLRNN